MSKKAAKSPAKPVGKTSAEFLKTYDKSTIVPAKIREALDKLGKSWLSDLDFMRMAGVSPTDMTHFCDEFEEYVVVVTENGRKGRRIWFGDKTLAAEMRGKLS